MFVCQRFVLFLCNNILRVVYLLFHVSHRRRQRHLPVSSPWRTAAQHHQHVIFEALPVWSSAARPGERSTWAAVGAALGVGQLRHCLGRLIISRDVVRHAALTNVVCTVHYNWYIVLMDENIIVLLCCEQSLLMWTELIAKLFWFNLFVLVCQKHLSLIGLLISQLSLW